MRTVAAWGLQTRHRFPADPLDEPAFAAFLMRCEHHRILGLVGAAAEAGEFATTAAQRERITQRWTGWLAHDLQLERVAQQTVAALGHAGIDSRVLKGLVASRSLYSDPSWRVFGDLDLLVPARAFSRAASVVCEVFGARRVVPELAPGFDDRFGREIALRVGGRREVDLHRTLVDGPYGHRVVLDDLFADPVELFVGGEVLRAPRPTAQFLHACIAAELGDSPPRGMSQRDVAQFLLMTDLDVAEVVATAQRWRMEAVLAAAIRRVWHDLALVDDHPLVDWLGDHHPRRLERVLLWSYRGPARGYRSHAAALLVIPGVSAKLAYLRAIARPSEDYLRARGLHGRTRVRIRRALSR